MGRYDRNIGTITTEEQALLAKKSVCVVGCGGLGGGVIENLTRMGVGELTLVDSDVFDETNLNRQVLSNEENLGMQKALEAARQMKLINPEVEITPVCVLLDEGNADEIIAGHDVVVDALDNVEGRLVLEAACEAEGIPVVHGAISGWNGQVAVVMPASRMLSKIYEEGCSEQDKPTNPSFTPAIVAGLQTAEVIKVLLGREGTLENRLLIIDLLEHEYEVIDFS